MGHNDGRGCGDNSSVPEGTDVYTTNFDWDSEKSTGIVVIEAIEAFRDDGLGPLTPLQHTIDVDALDKLFKPRSDGQPRLGGSVSFVVDEFRVTLHGEGYIAVQYAEQAA